MHQSDLNTFLGIYFKLPIKAPQIKNKYLIAKNLQLHELRSIIVKTLLKH